MILQEMIVTNAEGKIETSDGTSLTGQCIRGEDIYTFYAMKKKNEPKDVVTPEKKPAKVDMTLPIGGELNGMYRFPHVGEKVLVAVEGVKHFFIIIYLTFHIICLGCSDISFYASSIC